MNKTRKSRQNSKNRVSFLTEGPTQAGTDRMSKSFDIASLKAKARLLYLGYTQEKNSDKSSSDSSSETKQD